MMVYKPENNQDIFVTGGTSGLGLELVYLFLQEGYNVVATGRQQIDVKGFDGRFKLYFIDFSDLKQVAVTTKNICKNHSFSFIVNNAGILSPPGYIETIDGLEYTFQVNFLAHLLINEIIIKWRKDDRLIKMAAVTSPVFRYVGFNTGIKSGSITYNALRSYSSSKLYLAMMCEFLSSRHNDLNLHSFSFDPGTFRSGIYRMQNRWFRTMYQIASPFMRNPAKVAKVLSDILLKGDIVNGMIYDTSKRSRSLPEIDMSQKTALINSCYELIDPFLS
jgi:NAD(P)-dependent dehydrogenase (short-subunit alcohol dehydrogenase family)